MLTAAIFTIARTWKQPRCPVTDEWIKKLWYVYNGILLGHKKEWIWVSSSGVDKPRACLYRVRKRKTNIVYSCKYIESMVLMNLSVGKEWRHRCREKTCGHSEGRREWEELRKQHWHRNTLKCKTDRCREVAVQHREPSLALWQPEGWDEGGEGASRGRGDIYIKLWLMCYCTAETNTTL